MPVSPCLRLCTAAFMLFAFAMMTSGCGGNHTRQVRGELPTISLDSLTRTNGRIEVDVGIRNLNDSPMDIDSIRIALSVAEEAVAEFHDERLDLTVGARGREVIRLTGSDSDSLRESLDLLTSGERASLPWSMAIDLGRSGRSDRQTESNGFLHSVPGQPDRFR